jgi:hypothetical protein
VELLAVWNSLEVVKLLVGALTPILVGMAGFWLNRRLKALEAAQWAQQKIVERRIAAYDELAVPLNQLFCYFAYLGSWKEIMPPEVVAMKRAVDQCAHISAPLFDGKFLAVYNGFIDCCFATFGGWGEDAKLRTLTDRRRQAVGSEWEPSWDECFAEPTIASSPEATRSAYTAVMTYLARAMGATQVDAHMLGTGTLPINYEIPAPQVVSPMPAGHPGHTGS